MASTDAPRSMFCEAAAAFCDWARNDAMGADANEARIALRLLVDLYAAALRLPASPPCGEDVEAVEMSQGEWKQLIARMGSLPFSYYGVVYEPHAVPLGDPVMGHLADDLADIYRDIKDGLSLWTAGYQVEAVWHWKFQFRYHWGRHAADAIRALHVWLEREAEL